LKLSRELKTGIFAIVVILLFIFGYSYLKGTNILEGQRNFFVKYTNVEGLAVGAPVTVNGFQVGKVQGIDFLNGDGQLVVSFSIEKDFNFSRKSIVEIYSSGFIGGNNLGILPKYDPKDIAKSGDTLVGAIQQGILDQVTGKLAPLEAKIQSTLTNLDTLLISVNDVLDEKSRENMKRTIANLSLTVAEFRGASASLNTLLNENEDKLNSTIANLDNTTRNFSKLSDSLAEIEVGRMVKELESTLVRFNNIAAQIEAGEGTVGKLLKDEELYDNLSGASLQIEKLLEDMRLNPKRYVHFSLFGKRPKPYEPVEEPVEEPQE
jgi:phospholipid/cholesterol/gamma-HCH transport system substrate-binding protein